MRGVSRDRLVKLKQGITTASSTHRGSALTPQQNHLPDLLANNAASPISSRFCPRSPTATTIQRPASPPGSRFPKRPPASLCCHKITFLPLELTTLPTDCNSPAAGLCSPDYEWKSIMSICLSIRLLWKRQLKVLQGVLALQWSTPSLVPFFPSSFPSFQSNSSPSKKQGTKYLTKQILAATTEKKK